jgi:hypothetical protein
MQLCCCCGESPDDAIPAETKDAAANPPAFPGLGPQLQVFVMTAVVMTIGLMLTYRPHRWLPVCCCSRAPSKLVGALG